MSELALFPPPRPELPEDVTDIFDALCKAAQVPNMLLVMGVCATEGKPAHYIVGMAVPTGGMIPLAVIPSGISLVQYLKYFDIMAGKVGGAELDPEFKGVRQ